MCNIQKKYLVLTPFFPSKNDYRGIYIFDQIKEIYKQTDFEIKVIKIVSVFSKEQDYNYEGFDVLVFKLIDFPYFIFPGLFNFFNCKRIIRFIAKRNLDNIRIIHGHVTYPSAYLVNALSNLSPAKTIIHHHGRDVLQLENGRFSFIRNFQNQILTDRSLKQLNKIDVNIGVSKLVLNELNKYSKYIPKSEFVMYNGVDVNKFYPLKLKKNEVYTIGCIANFWELKDHITLIKSVESLFHQGYNLQLRLIGSGSTFSKCYKYVIKNKLSQFIFFEQEKMHHELNNFYNEIDLFVLPSYYEALGCVYLESWATNTPFIAIKGQGISELIKNDDQDIFLAEAKNPNSLVKCILYHMSSKRELIFDNNYRIDILVKFFIDNVIKGD